MKKKYYVDLFEVVKTKYVVVAENEEDAKKLVKDAGGEQIDQEFVDLDTRRGDGGVGEIVEVNV